MVSSSDIKMKGGVRYRLSPNEAARVIQEEKERRRKLRIVQVLFCLNIYETWKLNRSLAIVDFLNVGH